ncbi:MAG TPA: HAD family hydrolase [Burkholderiaceae bacterium]|nr:HAD family hydrolase [Burkholderiaceae bacterium]
MNDTLALFDLDHTLLAGDSDVLWCEFLMDRGVLDRAAFEPRNRAIEAGYRAGTVGVMEFCSFFIGTLAGRAPQEWQALREAFFAERVRPRFVAAGRACLEAHRAAGDTLVLTTATNRFLTELTAAALGVEHLIATECELDAEGRFTGRVAGEPNMREGKVARLRDWLAARGERLDGRRSVFYSDSINDLPLLAEVDEPVAVDPDPRLAAEADRRGWAVRRWRG